MCAFGKEKIDELAKDPRFIPGIYNYCDRWCEKCPYTGRCMNYELCEDHFDTSESKDIQNKEFWDKLGEVFAATMQMVKEHAEQMGIDLDNIDYEEIKREKDQIDTKSESHPCAKAAKEYTDLAGKWLDSSKDVFEEKEKDLQLQANIDLPNTNPFADAADLVDAVEVTRWYQHFIYVKLLRALHGLVRRDEDEIEMYDANGSAKVALIGIDRSIAAWGRLLEHFTEQEETLLPILVQLQRLRKSAENTFPDARNFIRPGLDEL